MSCWAYGEDFFVFSVTLYELKKSKRFHFGSVTRQINKKKSAVIQILIIFAMSFLLGIDRHIGKTLN